MEFFFDGSLWGQAAINLSIALFSLWLISVAIKDASIIDIFWGTGFIIIAWTCFATVDNPGPLAFTLAVMTTLWGGRLTLYLAYRNLGHGEDYRYQQFRKDAGKWFPIRSLFTVYALQGSIALVVALPLVMSIAQPGVHVSGVGYLGIAIFSVGFVFETLGDFQLTRFKADPSNKGKVLNTGLWRYTRHPNYFGDAVAWWGLFTVAMGADGIAWTIIGPALMTTLLVKVSGVALLEVNLKKTKPQYRDYIERTNAFLPWFPKPAASGQSSQEPVTEGN